MSYPTSQIEIVRVYTFFMNSRFYDYMNDLLVKNGRKTV